MPQKGHNQSNHWDGAQSQDSQKSNKFVLDTNDSSLRVMPLTDIEVTPCHCFPGEMCYDTCSIRKQFQEVTPKQCSKRLQTAANGYSVQGFNTEKFPGMKVLVGRNGLPIIVNPSFAFPSPSKCNQHLDNFPNRDPSMLCLGGQDFSTPPPPTPMSSSLPKSQLPILSLLSARECSSAPAICKGENESDPTFTSSPSSRSSSVSRDSRTSLSKVGGSRKSVLSETAENVTQKDDPHCNNITLQVEFNELLVNMNSTTTSTASLPQSHASSVSDVFPFSPSQTPSSCSKPSPFPSPRVAVAPFAAAVAIDAGNPSRTASQESVSSTRSATTTTPPVVVHTPSETSSAGSKAAVSIQVTPTCHSVSPSSPLGFPFSPTFSSFRSSRSFSGRAVTPVPAPSSSSVPPSSSATSCPSLPKVAVNSPPAPRAARGQPSIPPILEHAPLTAPTTTTIPTPTNGANKAHSSSTASKSIPCFPTIPVVSSHRCQVLNLTDAIRRLKGGLFEDDSPTEVFQDYYDWIEGRG